MRRTKKVIYSEYQIEYDSKSQKIFCPSLNMWINPLLKNGNEKIGKGVWQFSITAGNADVSEEVARKVTECIVNPVAMEELKALCGGTCGCRCEHCYALTGCYLFFSTRVCLARHAFLVRTNLDFVQRAITAQIEADKIKMVRIHVAGDMVSKEYCNMWSNIANKYQDTIFWTYTKQYFRPDMVAALDRFDSLSNCNIVKSLIKGRVNFGPCEYIIKLYHELKAAGNNVYICRCGIDHNQHCNNCSHCYKSQYVLFLKHSDNSYDPLKDPFYPDFVKLVESQEI